MGSLSSPANMEKIVLALLVCVAFLLLTVDAMPFNAVGPFYNGDMASAPSFDIKEHLWPGLTVKSFTLGVISRRATVPGLYRWGFFTPPVAGADFLAALVASCFLGAFPPVDLRAFCFVRAILRFS